MEPPIDTQKNTPEGELIKCPVCGHQVQSEPLQISGSVSCPSCKTLLWFATEPTKLVMTALEYGTQLLNQGNTVAALAVLQNAVALRPNDVVLRQTLRETQRKIRAKQEADEQSILELSTEVWWEIRQAKNKRADDIIDWDLVDRWAERGLTIDPWDVDLHVELGDACKARGYREVARFAYRCALETAPDRDDIKERLVELALHDAK